jgi:hypothetical protein
MKIKYLYSCWYIGGYDIKCNGMKTQENCLFTTHNQGVTGSSPVGPTKEKSKGFAEM